MAKVPDGAAVPVAGPVSDQPQRVDQMALYLHVPFCSVRCGYCDFNTYTAEELARDGVTISRERYVDQALLELAAARTALGDGEIRVGSIFVGGGTPTLLEPRELGRFFSAASEYFSLDADAEITVEANPDTLDEKYLAQLREAGATRLSMGMQSAVPHVLDTLERTHRPENVERSVRAAQVAGFEHISVDLIYGTPGESLADWQQTLEAAADLAVDHISAYALIVEEGTKLAQQVHRGELQMPDDDQTAEKYLMADAAFTDLGMQWY
jgi:oxygen-independent coproporphyrinogen-3 oxidase